MRRRISVALTVAAVVLTFAAGSVLARGGALPEELQGLRGAVARYHSFNQALRDGYSIAGEPCVSAPPGAMGIHAVNFDLLMSGENDPSRPPILLYFPRGDGYELVGVEYWGIALANTESGPAPWFEQTAPPLGIANPAPELFGRTFDGPMAGHNPQMPWHYDLHVWLFEDNPAGAFEMFNPALSC